MESKTKLPMAKLRQRRKEDGFRSTQKDAAPAAETADVQAAKAKGEDPAATNAAAPVETSQSTADEDKKKEEGNSWFGGARKRLSSATSVLTAAGAGKLIAGISSLRNSSLPTGAPGGGDSTDSYHSVPQNSARGSRDTAEAENVSRDSEDVTEQTEETTENPAPNKDRMHIKFNRRELKYKVPGREFSDASLPGIHLAADVNTGCCRFFCLIGVLVLTVSSCCCFYTMQKVVIYCDGATASESAFVTQAQSLNRSLGLKNVDEENATYPIEKFLDNVKKDYWPLKTKTGKRRDLACSGKDAGTCYKLEKAKGDKTSAKDKYVYFKKMKIHLAADLIYTMTRNRYERIEDEVEEKKLKGVFWQRATDDTFKPRTVLFTMQHSKYIDESVSWTLLFYETPWSLAWACNENKENLNCHDAKGEAVRWVQQYKTTLHNVHMKQCDAEGHPGKPCNAKIKKHPDGSIFKASTDGGYLNWLVEQKHNASAKDIETKENKKKKKKSKMKYDGIEWQLQSKALCGMVELPSVRLTKVRAHPQLDDDLKELREEGSDWMSLTGVHVVVPVDDWDISEEEKKHAVDWNNLTDKLTENDLTDNLTASADDLTENDTAAVTTPPKDGKKKDDSKKDTKDDSNNKEETQDSVKKDRRQLQEIEV